MTEQIKSNVVRVNSKAFSLATMFLATTFIAIGLGLIVRFPLIGWPVVIMAIPVFFRTVRIIQSRLAQGKVITNAEKLKVFAKTLLIVSALVLFWCVSVVTCIVTLCGVTLEVSDARGNETLLLAGLFALGALGVFAASRFNRAYEARYRRDISEE